MKVLLAAVSPGELIDKITILQIKLARIADVEKLRHVRRELEDLLAVRDQGLQPSEELDQWTAELRTVNEALWEVEDDLRACERVREFGGRFIELARQVYHHNDRRAAIKRRINLHFESPLVEEKAYAAY